ncbi:hypothetical protein FRC04_004509 [Tulasnella sp. 424]|nr:hypothetical protein FRC04_004509 [Tulasnella sp. 424]KAG8976578.1 hypothetical protein FRC05_003417 [Tulasnella sp. 425]
MPSRIVGRTHATTGGIQARVSRFFGFHDRAAAHRGKQMMGHTERHAATTSGWAGGTGQRIRGKGHSILGAITGSRRRQARGNAKNNMGQMRQNINTRF